MSLVNKIKNFLGFDAMSGNVVESRLTQTDKEKIGEEYKRQLGIKDGQLMKQKEEIQELHDRLKKTDKKRKEERKKKQKERRKRIGGEDRKTLDLFKLAEFVKKGGKIKVISRDHRFLGYLHTIKSEPVADKLLWTIYAQYDKDVHNLVDGFNINNLIHRPDGFIDALESKILVLNRNYSSRVPIPDKYITEYGEEKHIETYLAQQEEQLRNIFSQYRLAKQKEQEERTRRKKEKVGYQVEKTRADALSSDLLSTIKSTTETVKNYRDMQEGLASQSDISTRSLKQVKSLESAMTDMFKMLEKESPKSKVNKARDEIMENIDYLKQIQKEDEKKEEER